MELAASVRIEPVVVMLAKYVGYACNACAENVCNWVTVGIVTLNRLKLMISLDLTIKSIRRAVLTFRGMCTNIQKWRTDSMSYTTKQNDIGTRKRPKNER